ncbi:MAG: hypothetical protein JSR36_19335 [Proteobacteria bacterium]|nr:hypothetical protein [Pseudomonadota bacterium]
MEERFLQAWDTLDDWLGLCRHLATQAAAEVLAGSAARAQAAAGLVIAGTATLLLAVRQLFSPAA